ncbi:hypothetical protein Mia14_0406 [Candidatus Mancarchaeum acidiphilum]|uniref:Uncharacterized protein n=1 Tax=Candidatus Mancarchaeum acidiphilum TaxID=1920749 RepID=A0A218NMQ0_9ARCH|nr:hypothetical protein [Candidatus Mancarchaeum acidiphilum]ASI13726.1 hypothetical protein Mia14_0406 [Candidatus Mancarchaeum acidiphilum]
MVFKNKVDKIVFNKNEDLDICNKAMHIYAKKESFKEIQHMLDNADMNILQVEGGMIDILFISYKNEKVALVEYSIEDKGRAELTVYKDNGWREKLDDIYKEAGLIGKHTASEINKDPHSSLAIDYKKIVKYRTEEAEKKLYNGSLNDLLDKSINVYDASSKFDEIKEALYKKRISINLISNRRNDVYIDISHNGKLVAKISKYGERKAVDNKLFASIYDGGWQKDLYEIYSRSKELEGEDNQKSELKDN